jgi:hypothetical protein
VDAPRQGIALFSAIGLLIATLVIIQLWLLAAALDALLGGHVAIVLPAAVASMLLFLANGGLLLLVRGFDRRVRTAGADGAAGSGVATSGQGSGEPNGPS